MDLSYKQRTTKIFVYCILIIISALLQNTSGLTVEIGGARCFILLPVCIILGMGEDEALSSVLALFGGLLWDMFSAVHMGFNAIFMCIICFFGSALVTYIIRNTFITNFIYATVSILLYCLLYWLFFIIIKNVSGAELTLFSFYIPCAIYTVLVTPIIYFSLKPIKKRLTSRQNI
ncbi:MAG: hypothetical protein LUG21_07935 [Clostridiales bacterium]|nr:hypothetical protein [Clostridiales bacterium]